MENENNSQFSTLNSPLVPPGYKQTEVGVIPEDWEVGHVNDLIHKMNSGLSRRLEARDIGIPVLISGNIQNNRLVTDELKYWYTKDPQGANIDDYVLNDGDILLCFINSISQIGKPCIFRDIGRPVIYTTNLFRIVTSNRCVTEFAYFLLSSEAFQKNIQLIAKPAVNQASFTKPDFLQICVPLPSLAEQEAITEALSDADALIESLEQLITKKRQIKQGAMQELLTGKRRLPGFAKATISYKQAETGMIPEDWDVQGLSTLLAEPPTYGINAPAIPYDMRQPTYLRITDISDEGRFIEESKASVKHPEAGKYILSNGDLVFARTGASVGKSYLYDPADGILVFAGFLIRVRTNAEKLSSKFLKFYTHSRQYWKWVNANSMRSGQPGINGQEYASLPIPLPPTKAEQEAIAEILSDMDAEIVALEAKLAKARQIKQGMMHVLLTGKIRLVES